MSSLFFDIIDLLISCACIVSATFVFAKMGKGGSKMSLICLYVWACLMLFADISLLIAIAVLEGGIAVPDSIEENVVSFIFGVRGILSLVGMILLIVFLLMRIRRTSVYKTPLMVGMAGVALGIVHSLSNFIPITGWAFHTSMNLAQSLLMATSFVLMFFASRRLEKRVGQC